MLNREKSFLIALTFFAAAIGLGAWTTCGQEQPQTRRVYHNVAVGETFWDICADYRELDSTNPYLPQYICDIYKLNPAVEKSKGQVYPGQQIIIEYKE